MIEYVTYPSSRRARTPGFSQTKSKVKDGEVVQVPIEHEARVRHQKVERGTSDNEQSKQREESLVDHPEQQSEHSTGLRRQELKSDPSDCNLSEQNQEPLRDFHRQLEHEETDYEPSSLGNFIPETASKLGTEPSGRSMYTEPSYSHGSFLPCMKDSFLDQLRSDTLV